MGINETFWRGKKVLVTGHTGFKGSWLSLWLQMLEADVYGLSRLPPTEPNLFERADVGKRDDIAPRRYSRSFASQKNSVGH
nr:hypothetical protein [Methylomarinum sp. Ch1-1]MDP4519221.1 hypothetical protein [Methylomarinum sp. Ch1-1]